MAEWTQLNPATATTGSILAGDFITLGTTTDVFVQRAKIGYGTDSAYTDTATNAPFPVVMETFRATGSVSVIQPTATELNVTVATGSVLNIQQMSTATSPVSVGTWTATGQVLISPLATATMPVSVGTWTATGQVLISALASATMPVSVGTLTATGVLFINNAGTATLIVSVNNTATVNIANTATIQGNVGGRWAHDATSTGNPIYTGGVAQTSRPTAVAAGDVVQAWLDPHGRQVTTPICVRGDILESQFTVSATTVATMATAGAAGVFHDLIWMTMVNNATTEAQVRIRSTSTATKWPQLNIAPDGGGISFTPARPATQAAAAGTWDVQLNTALTGQICISAEFARTT